MTLVPTFLAFVNSGHFCDFVQVTKGKYSIEKIKTIPNIFREVSDSVA